MKAMGKGSVSSLLLIVLNGASVFLAIFLIITTALAVFTLNTGRGTVAVQIGSDLSPSVETGPNVHMSIPVSFTISPQALRVSSPSLGIQDAEIRSAQGTLRFAPQGGPFLTANLALVIGLFALGLWILAQLRALFRTLRDGKPFASANAMRVRRIAWAVIVMELARAMTIYFENAYAASHFVADGLQFDAQPHVNGFVILNGLIIFVISEVFRAGTRLDEDQSLTV